MIGKRLQAMYKNTSILLVRYSFLEPGHVYKLVILKCDYNVIPLILQVFNLSEPKRTLRSEHKNVKEVGWSPRLAPPLEKICSVCKDIDSWLSADQHRIAVLHAKYVFIIRKISIVTIS